MLLRPAIGVQLWSRTSPWILSTGAVLSCKKRLLSKSSDGSHQTGNMNVITERHGTILTIGINRPNARNAVNPETASQLVQAFNEFEKDPSLTSAVLHGLGGNFCAGFDLKEIANNTTSLKIEPDVTSGPGPMGPSRMQFSKPVIAAVSGYCVAGGLELSLLADMRVVEKSATFGVFCRRFGVPLIDGGTVRLPQLIGLSRALDLILTGRPVNAQEAYEFGLANRVVPDGQGLQSAIKLAEQISAFPQKCMRSDRVSAYYSTFDATSFTDAMQFEFNHGSEVLAEESVAGASRFTAGEGRKGKL
ncbi:enoyl-CoA hydratase EchA19-like isoform X3 [Rhinoderma darwinii]